MDRSQEAAARSNSDRSACFNKRVFLGLVFAVVTYAASTLVFVL